MLPGATVKKDFDKEYETFAKQFDIKCKCNNGSFPKYVDIHDIPCPIFQKQCEDENEFTKDRLYCDNCAAGHNHTPILIYRLLDEEMNRLWVPLGKRVNIEY